jgi:hypothetical protein
MKNLALFAAIGAVALGSLAYRSTASTTPVAAPAAALGTVDGPLHDAMEQMNACMRFFLKEGAKAENKDKALETVAKMQSAVLVSKLEKPKDLPAAELPGYRKMLVDVLATTCRIELAILDGKFDEANKIAKEELTKLKKDGHDRYQPEEEEHK